MKPRGSDLLGRNSIQCLFPRQRRGQVYGGSHDALDERGGRGFTRRQQTARCRVVCLPACTRRRLLPHTMLLPRSASIAAAALLGLTTLARAEVRVTEVPGKVRVDVNARLFTELILRGAPHIYYWPLMGPGEVPVTRAWPMEDRPAEEHDHPHHRSMWFAHGLVNGMDFWSEPATFGARPPKQPLGKIVHEKVIETKSGANEGLVRTAQNWVAPDGSIPVTSTQTLRVFQRPETEREFEFSTTLTAGDKDVI